MTSARRITARVYPVEQKVQHLFFRNAFGKYISLPVFLLKCEYAVVFTRAIPRAERKTCENIPLVTGVRVRAIGMR